jgi:hypothetical protein
MYFATSIKWPDDEYRAWSGVGRSCTCVLEGTFTLLIRETEENSDRYIWMVGYILFAMRTKAKRYKRVSTVDFVGRTLTCWL